MASCSPERFLAHRRLALIGLSRDPRSLSRALFTELRARGYDVVPVNPSAGSIDGVPCVASVRDIRPPVDGAILMTPASGTADAVHDCAFAGVPRVWLHRGVGPGSVSDEALAACAEERLEVVAGRCAFMDLDHAGWIHRAHAWWRGHATGH